VSTEDTDATLEGTIANVYRGPLEDFVQRRDALAKELRSAGKRDAASTIKALRKPSRFAWALDMGVLESPQAFTALLDAIGETVGAQVSGGDLRAAVAKLRAASREFATQATHAAEQAGQRLESSALSNALLAVLGNTESFNQLRRGHLADIPEAGGLDLLTSLPALADLGSRPAPEAAREPVGAPARSPKANALEAAARETVRLAAAALVTARERSVANQEALTNAEAKLQAAEARLRAAEAEARAVRSQRDRARLDADDAAAQLADADAAAAEAESRLEQILRSS
jgi:hypothetical protein